MTARKETSSGDSRWSIVEGNAARACSRVGISARRALAVDGLKSLAGLDFGRGESAVVGRFSLHASSSMLFTVRSYAISILCVMVMALMGEAAVDP
jgi:hypothetical protein